MSAANHILVIGGHGKVAQLLTPLLLRRAWDVTSVVRAPAHVAAVEALAAGLPGRLRVRVCSVADVDSEGAARAVLDDLRPSCVVWSAGAGGKGGAEMTYRVDRDAATHFIRASAAADYVKRFLLVSYIGSRRGAAPWWPAAEWPDYDARVNHGALATYYEAKLAADEALYRASARPAALVGICLRPGTLTDAPAAGVELGRTSHLAGQVSREAVAQAADALLAAEGVASGWLDLLDGSDEVGAAVARAVSGSVDAAEGEPIYAS